MNKKLDSNGVYVGSPAKYICSIDEYYEKRKNAQVEEASILVKEYRKMYNDNPPKELLREFFWIFEKRDSELSPTFKKVLKLEGNEEISTKKFNETEPLFNGYESFLESIGE